MNHPVAGRPAANLPTTVAGENEREGLLHRVDSGFFVFGGLASVWLAYLVFKAGFTPGWPWLLMIAFWVLVAYLTLPRIHRILTRIYLPDYFIGRTHTADGLLGDPINIALRGTESQLHKAMTLAGWTRAADLTLATGWRIVTTTLTRRSYPEAPVSPLFMFSRQQDFAYQQEVAGSPSKRHHVRFWKCPDGWLLPGGFQADWLAAGTYDRNVGLSLFTLQITHKIDPDVDAERDHIVTSLAAANQAAQVDKIEQFSTGYHSRNGGGDLIETDGHLPVVDLSGLAAADVLVRPTLDSPAARPAARPVQVVFGAAVAGLRGLLFLAIAGAAAAAAASGAQGELLSEAVIVAYAIGAVVDLTLAVALLANRNWARIVLCATSVASILIAFLNNAQGVELIGLETNLLSVAVSVLVLLALSSERARSFESARRAKRRRTP